MSPASGNGLESQPRKQWREFAGCLMDSPASRLLPRLQGVRETGPCRWIAQCPAHDDRSPSLSVRELEDGRLLIHDFAGCEPFAVLTAVGLEMKDLFPAQNRKTHWPGVLPLGSGIEVEWFAGPEIENLVGADSL